MRSNVMKSLLSLILGVGLAVFLFIGLLAGVTWALSTTGQHRFANLDEKPLWTSKPVRVDPASQSLVRLAAAPVPPAFQAMAVDIPEHEEAEMRMAATPKPDVDDTITGAIGTGPMMDLAGTPHAEWCFRQYRSYRVEDNSYQPYSGPRRQCGSPYMEQQAPTGGGFHDIAQSGVSPEGAIQAPVRPENAHAEWCLGRYNSYRPSDNTYQPYHGPRRPCVSPFD
jgi:hypothetical protein